jgi:hypothetical protein
MENQWVVRCLGETEGPSDWQEMVGRGKRWEATSTSLQWYDSQPLPSVPDTPQVGRDFYLDEPCAAKGFVSVTPTSLVWKDRAGKFDMKFTQGVATSIHAQYSWTVPSGAWAHRRALFRGDAAELVRLVIPQPYHRRSSLLGFGGTRGAGTTGENGRGRRGFRVLHHPETARKRRLRSSGEMMKDRW